MIEIKHYEHSKLIEVSSKGHLRAEDFEKAGPAVDKIIAEIGAANILLDARELQGWSDLETVKTHFTFVHEHHRKIAKLAIVAGASWQQWLATAVSIFVHPEVKCFNADEIAKAREWLK